MTVDQYTVTSLNDDGPGSLRWGIEHGANSVSFAVGGCIDLRSSIEVQKSVTIDAQTAPAPGITLRKADGVNSILGLIRITAGEKITIRHLRLRPGDGIKHTSAALQIDGGNTITIEHCSLSWTHDNLAGVWQKRDVPDIHDIIFKYCLFAEPYADHPTGVAVAGERAYDEENGRLLYEEGQRIRNVILWRCVFVHVSHRVPESYAGSSAGGVEVLNCLVYDWRPSVSGALRNAWMDWRGNYYKPSEYSALFHWRYEEYYDWLDSAFLEPPSLHVSGNYAEGILETPSDQWDYIRNHSQTGRPPLPRDYERLKPLHSHPELDIIDPHKAYQDIIDNAGAQPRDVIDRRLIDDIKYGRAQKNLPANLGETIEGGWPDLTDLSTDV